jgi:hypothetical protein
VQCHEVRTEEDKAALLESVRSRGLPTNLPVIRLIEISGYAHVTVLLSDVHSSDP